MVGLFRKRNYKVRVSIGANASVMKSVAAVLDTGAGQTLIDSRFIPSDWSNRIKMVRDPKLTGATSEKRNLTGFILLHIRLGDLRVRAWFGVVENFAVKVLLGTSFIDWFLK